MASVSAHIAPSPVSIARYGGKPVSSEKTGTARRDARPVANTSLPRGARATGSPASSARSISPSDTCPTRKARLPTRHTTDGRNSSVTVAVVDRLWLIHSIVVVTSPIGVHTPPAFAATTTIAPNSLRSTGSGMIFLSSETITIVTVRLFRMEERKNVRKPMIQKSCFLSLVLMLSVTTLKPWCASTTSTMVLAARRKKHMSETSASCSFSCSRTFVVATPAGEE
mmetsp:Transcript_14064/g.28866  ORF Transcript_14064/g.28866 Transcript_14064/m.28866 type:complete len:225 (-) Transcript_14064:849-1523(-)